jgi:hypothetical protein
MHRFVGSVIVLFLAAAAAAAQGSTRVDLTNYGVRIEPDKRLIVVLAALEMAGTKDSNGKLTKILKAPLSPMGTKFREELIQDNADMPDELRGRITAFVSQYKRARPNASDAELVRPFISMSYALSPAPELADPIITSDLPGNLLDVLDFAPLVREYYRKSTIAPKLDNYVKEYKQLSEDKLRPSIRDMVNELLDYLHTRPQLVFTEKVRVDTPKAGSKEKISKTEIREHERHFFVVPEALAPRGDVNFVNIRDDYFLIVPPDTDVSGSEARRAFLRFVVDPLILANAREMQSIRDWSKPVLETLRKAEPGVSGDPFLAMSRSMVAAVDVRETEYLRTRVATEQARAKLGLLKTDAEKRAVTAALEKQKQEFADEATLQLFEEYQKGAILSFYFAEQLKGVEDSGFDIASSLKDMIVSFDAAKESNRAAATADARKRALAARETRRTSPAVATIENPVTAKLIEIQRTIDARDLVKAQADLKQLLTQFPAEPRIYYNLGRVAGLSAAAIQNPEAQAAKLVEAKVAYSNVISSANSSTDPVLMSLTYVALGRIYEYYGDPATATQLYDKAIKIGEITGSGYNEAWSAKQRLVKTQP